MNLYQKLACTLMFSLGILLFAITLKLAKDDVASYRSAQPQVVTVEQLHLVTEHTSDHELGQLVHVTAEMTLKTPRGVRVVSESRLLKPERARLRIAELEALRGRTLTLYLSEDAPHAFALTHAFEWGWVLAGAFVLVLLILPPVLAVRAHLQRRSGDSDGYDETL